MRCAKKQFFPFVLFLCLCHSVSLSVSLSLSLCLSLSLYLSLSFYLSIYLSISSWFWANYIASDGNLKGEATTMDEIMAEEDILDLRLS